MDAIRKLAGYSSPGAQQAAADAAMAEDYDGDLLPEEEEGNDAGLGPGPGVLPIRAPISVDDADLGDGDGEASFGSGESFDSALERMAASSTVSLETGSPVGSFHDGGSPLHDNFGNHRQNHTENHFRQHDGNESKAGFGNGNEAEEQPPAMPVAKLTADDESLDDEEARDDSAEDTAEENGDDGLEFEEAEGGEDVTHSEEDDEIYARVTAEGLPVRNKEEIVEKQPQPLAAQPVSEGAEVEGVKETEAPQGQSNSPGAALVEEFKSPGAEPGAAEDYNRQNGLPAGEAVDTGPTSDDVLEENLPKSVEPLVQRAEEDEKDEEHKKDGESLIETPAASAVAVAEVHDVGLLPKEEEGNDAGLEPEPGVPLIQAPISVEDADLVEGGGEARLGSGESHDSAVEGIAASSIVSLEAGSPVASFHDGGSPLDDNSGHHSEDHTEDHSLHHDGSEAKVGLENGNEVEEQSPAFPVAKSTADDEPLKDEGARDDSPKNIAEENGDDSLKFEEAEGGEDVSHSEEDEIHVKVTAEGPLVRIEDELVEKPLELSGTAPAPALADVEGGKETEPPQAQSDSSGAVLVEEPKSPGAEPGAAEDFNRNGPLAGETVETGPTAVDVLEEILSRPVEPEVQKAGVDSGVQKAEVEPGVQRAEVEPEVQRAEVEPEVQRAEEDEKVEKDEENEKDEKDEKDGEDGKHEVILVETAAASAAVVAEDDDEDLLPEEEEGNDAGLEPGPDSSSEVNRDAPSTGVPSMGSAGPSLPARPAGLGRSVPSLEPVPRVRGGGAAASTQPAGASEEAQPNGESNDGHEETREKLQLIRVKFLRLAHRLGQSAHNVVVAQVLYRLGLAEQLRGGRSSGRSGAFSFDRASAIAEEQEAAGPGELHFTCTIMLLGKTGVGKSATINSIFDEVKTVTNAFSPATRKVQEIIGTVHGIKVRVIDTPGLLPSVSDQRQNEKVMSSVKRFIKKSPPDIVLYFDRLDMQSRDYGDLPLLRTITDTFGPAVWFNAIVVLTHAASAPPDGPNGLPLSYEMFVAQRSHVVQQTIRHAAGDMRLMNPVSLVENHPACRTNRAGQRVLPNGQIWKPQLLLLCFASKILAEANSLLKLQDSAPGRPFGSRQRVPPLPFLLSSLLQSRQQLKMMDDQGGDEEESDDELDEEDNSDDETEFDQLPPFRRLSKEEVLELDDQQRKDYFQELADRERLFQKKQWKEELRRRKELKKRMAAVKEQHAEEAAEDEGARSAAVPVPLPDMVLPPSFDSDSPTHRYRYLEAPNQWLVRPVLETHGWDHDSGYDGFSVEKSFAVNNKFPAQVSGQLTKDKKETNLTLECAASFKHGEGKVTLSGLDVQTIGKDLAYTLRSETRFSNFKHNKTTGGLALTLLGDTIAAGLKLENRLLVGKRLKLVVNGGALTGKGDVAYGGSLEATLRDKDYPFSRTLSTLGLSIMDWHGDLAIGGNLQSQFLLGKTMVSARANLNNRGAGQISIRSSSSEQLQMALVGIIPILRAVFSSKLFGSSQAG